MKQKLLALLLTGSLLLAGCTAAPPAEPIGKKLTVEDYTSPAQNYTLGEGSQLKEYILTSEEHVDNIYYYDYTFYDDDTLLLTCAFEKDGDHMGATVYHMDLDDREPVGFYYTEIGYDGPTSYRDIYANPTQDGCMVYEDDTLVFFDRDFQETRRISLEKITQETGEASLLFNPDYTKAAVTLSDEKDPQDQTKEYYLYLYDLESGQRTEVARSFQIEEGVPPAYGGAGIPIPMHWSKDGTLLYRFYQWEWLLDGFSLYYPDGTSESFTYDSTVMGDEVGPVEFLGDGTTQLICSYTGYGNAASSMGIYDREKESYTPLSLAGDNVFPWWNQDAPTAFYIDNVMFNFGEQPQEDAAVEYGLYLLEGQKRLPLLTHPVYTTERSYLADGFPTMSILGQTDDNTHYGYSISPKGDKVVTVAEIDHQNYLSVLSYTAQ